jgi:hypothetical protein
MAESLPEEWFLSDARTNAVLAWAVTALLGLTALAAAVAVRPVSAVLAATGVVLVAVPAVLARSWTRTIPWPMVLLAALPLFANTAAAGFLGLVVSGVGVAALGMLLVVVLGMVTAVRMTPWFAVVFVVLVTLAFVGWWAVLSLLFASAFGTPFLETNTQLMYVFTAALLGGVAGGGLFWLYFRRQLRRRPPRPAPEEVGTA